MIIKYNENYKYNNLSKEERERVDKLCSLELWRGQNISKVVLEGLIFKAKSLNGKGKKTLIRAINTLEGYLMAALISSSDTFNRENAINDAKIFIETYYQNGLIGIKAKGNMESCINKIVSRVEDLSQKAKELNMV